MQLSNAQIISKLHIKIQYTDDSVQSKSVESKFDIRPLPKNVPTALWGDQLKPSLQGEQMIPHLLTGYEIRAKRPTEAPQSAPIDYKTFQEGASLQEVTGAFSWSQLVPFMPKELDNETALQEIQDTLYNDEVANKRDAIAKALF